MKKRTNMPEYQVYRDTDELVEHYRKRHFTCDMQSYNCYNLAFEDST